MADTRLQLTRYRPKYDDPRVRSRVEVALDWASGLLIESQPRRVASSTLTAVFGNQTSNALGVFLRANLLVPVGTYVPGKKTLAYTIRREGFDKLSAVVGFARLTDVELARKLYGRIADGKEQPLYSEPTRGKRRYHPVQNLRRVLRSRLFEGWHDYDIEAAAPTLVLQFARKASNTEFPILRRLVDDKVALRKHIQALTGREMKDVKRVVNGLFFGAKLSASNRTSVFRSLGEDEAALNALKNDQVVNALIREAKLMWEVALAADAGRRSGSGTLEKRRMALYLSLEREVIDVMETRMKADGVKYVLMHDGFMVHQAVSSDELCALALHRTGFEVRLSDQVIEAVGEAESKGGDDDETGVEVNDEVPVLL